MLVDVICMRYNGAKLPQEQLRSAFAMRAELSLCYFYGRIIATLSYPWNGPTAPGTNLPRLYECRIRTIKGDDIVLHGREYVGMNHEQREVPQAWWCHVLPECERPPDRWTPHPAVAAAIDAKE